MLVICVNNGVVLLQRYLSGITGNIMQRTDITGLTGYLFLGTDLQKWYAYPNVSGHFNQ